jgi:phage recombination protein Bet
MTATTLHDANARPSVGTQTAERERPTLDPTLTAPAPLVRTGTPPDSRESTRDMPSGAKPDQIEFTSKQLELLKRTIAYGATDDEFELFVGTCKRLRLDPFARQVYFLKRRTYDKNANDGRGGYVEIGRTETSIDGYRLVAERTGEYRGQIPAEWADVSIDEHTGDVNIRWFPVWPYTDRTPYAARVGVVRADFAQPLYEIARYDAYVQLKEVWQNNQATGRFEPNAMWSKRGPEQLAKCAEALALRKAFPNELSGVWTSEEMDQSENPENARSESQPRPASPPRRETRAGNLAKPKPKPREPEQPKPAAQSPSQPGSLVFPFKPFRGVLLDAKDAVTGAYVIDYETLARGGDAAMRAHSGDVDGIPPADRPKWLVMANAISKECERRIAERDDALATAQQATAQNESQAPATPATPAITPDNSDAIETDECPTCNGQGGRMGTGDNTDMIECPDCGGSGKIERGEAFEG